jgi:hypothetical protein
MFFEAKQFSQLGEGGGAICHVPQVGLCFARADGDIVCVLLEAWESFLDGAGHTDGWLDQCKTLALRQADAAFGVQRFRSFGGFQP